MPSWKDRAEVVKPSWKDRAEVVEPEGPAPLGTAIEQAGQAVSLGYLPQITAALESPLDEESRAYLNAPIGDLLDSEFRDKAAKGRGVDKTYQEIRDEKIAQFKEGQEANPVASTVGTGAGMVASMLSIPAKAFGPVNTLGQAAKAGAKSGVAYGALANPGDVAGEVSPLQLGDRAFNSVLGGVVGVGGGMLGYGAQKGVGALIDKAGPAAEDMAARALGRGTQGFKQQMGEKGLRTMGREALDSGVIGVIPKGAEAMNKAVDAQRKAVGKGIGNIIDKIDDAERSLAPNALGSVGVSKKTIADKVRAEVLDPDSFPDKKLIALVEDQIENLMSRGGDSPSIATKAANELKTNLGRSMEKSGVWKRVKMGVASPEDQVKISMYNALNDGVMEGASKVASAMPAEQATIQELFKKYSTLKNMQTLTSKEAARESTNNIFSLTSMIGAAGSLARGGNPLDVGMVAGSIEGAKRFGPQIGAKALDVAGKGLQKFQQPIQSVMSPARAAVGANKFSDLLTQWEKTKDKPVSQDEAAQMYLNQGTGK